MTSPPASSKEAIDQESATPKAAQTDPAVSEPTLAPVWTAPTFVFDQHDEVSLAWSSKDGSDSRIGLLRTARWCIDGSTILTTSEDRSIRLYSTPSEFAPSASMSKLEPSLTLPQAAPILSSLWYPTATPSAPEAFCFAAAIRDGPVRLIDGITGRIRATYPIVDHRERFVAPYSMAWNPSATKLYCGHENAIEVLDISAPGYDTSERIKTTLTRGDKGGQKGIISALSFSTDYSGLYAAGSFGGSVSLYSEDESGAVGHLDGIQGGGVTQLTFHPSSPNHLFVASRRSSLLQVFDLRNPSEPFHCFPRSASTNQRMAFDLDPWGRWVAVGDELGKVGIWDVSGSGQWGERIWDGQVGNTNDAISSVQFHPLKPLLLVSLGSRHVDLVVDASDSDSDTSDEEDGSEEDDDVIVVGAETTGESREIVQTAQASAAQRGSGLGIISFSPRGPLI